MVDKYKIITLCGSTHFKEQFIEAQKQLTLTLDDIKNLDIHLSIGDIVCHGVAETEEEIEALKTSTD